MGKTPREVGGCVALPLSLPSTEAFQHDALHYLYVKPHDPKVPDQDSPRSLFLVNIPISATVASLKHLFSTHLGGALIETVYFADNAPGKPSLASKSSRKRKRKTAEELEAGLDTYSLPDVFDSEIHQSGATAIVVFVDIPSMELAFKSAKRAAKSGSSLMWNEGAETPGARLGLTRYQHHKHLQYPSRKELLRSVNTFMTAYAEMEESRSRENARKRQMPDEDGFVTVARGSKGSSRMEEAKELAIKHKEKEKSLEDFYRFQMRERRKEQHAEMLNKFEDDKRRVEEMRQRRHRFKCETTENKTAMEKKASAMLEGANFSLNNIWKTMLPGRYGPDCCAQERKCDIYTDERQKSHDDPCLYLPVSRDPEVSSVLDDLSKSPSSQISSFRLLV